MHPKVETETVLLFLLIVNKLLHLSSPHKVQKFEKVPILESFSGKQWSLELAVQIENKVSNDWIGVKNV